MKVNFVGGLKDGQTEFHENPERILRFKHGGIFGFFQDSQDYYKAYGVTDDGNEIEACYMTYDYLNSYRQQEAYNAQVREEIELRNDIKTIKDTLLEIKEALK